MVVENTAGVDHPELVDEIVLAADVLLEPVVDVAEVVVVEEEVVLVVAIALDNVDVVEAMVPRTLVVVVAVAPEDVDMVETVPVVLVVVAIDVEDVPVVRVLRALVVLVAVATEEYVDTVETEAVLAIVEPPPARLTLIFCQAGVALHLGATPQPIETVTSDSVYSSPPVLTKFAHKWKTGGAIAIAGKCERIVWISHE